VFFDKEELESCKNLLESQRRRLDQSNNEITGYNIGVKIGAGLGQTVNTCHIHLAPRRIGTWTTQEVEQEG